MFCKLTRYALIAAVVALLFLPASQVRSQRQLVPENTRNDLTVVTLSSALVPVSASSGQDPQTHQFGHENMAIKTSSAFSIDRLKTLPMVTVRADFPKGRQQHDYFGPLLADVLNAAGATGDMVSLEALDGLSIEAPLQDLIAMGAVVAFGRDGKMFSEGDFGPTQIVFPRGERDDLAEMNDDLWVWSIFHIVVK